MRGIGAVRIGSMILILGAPRPAPTQEDRLSPSLHAVIQRSSAGEKHVVWVFFRDKGAQAEASMAEAGRLLTPRARSRRAIRGSASPASFEDRPLVRQYVDEVARRVARLRQESRWFNAVSVEATSEQLRAVEGLPFVSRLDLVRRYRRSVDQPESELAGAATDAMVGTGPSVGPTPRSPASRGLAIDYGTSLGQVRQINVPAVHGLGLHGEGVVIAVFDAGFSNLAHEVFSSMSLLARRDFVNGDDDVGDGRDMGEGSHGTATLSILGGYKEGQLVGPAFGASFILAKTENTDSETPVEEDNWAAAAEWAEALGADVISSSLGYLEYDKGFPSYDAEDMDGETAISTRAASLAAARGVVVVTSAGNEGFSSKRNTLGAPADGKRVLAVAAVDRDRRRTEFSSVGPSADGRIKPDIAAQGSSVKLAASKAPAKYSLGDGTSFSCPLAAGAAALVLQAHPEYTVDQVLAALRKTASQAAAPDNLLGWGLVDALAAVRTSVP